MFARCARVAPARVRARPGSEKLISRCFSDCTTDTPLDSGSDREPLAPLMVTASGAMVAVTPWGRSTGALAILDITMLFGSGDDAQDFAALPVGACLAIGHHALRRRHDHRAHAAEYLRQLVLAAIDAQARPADTLQAVDDGAPLEVLQPNGQARLGALAVEAEVGDVALVLQHLDDRRLQARGIELHLALARGLAVADAGEEISNGIGHAHAAYLTSSPWRALESRRGSPLRGPSPATGRTCGTRRANAR